MLTLFSLTRTTMYNTKIGDQVVAEQTESQERDALRAEVASWKTKVTQRFDDIDMEITTLKGGHSRLSDRLEENTKITQSNHEVLKKLDANLGTLSAIIQDGAGFFRFGKRVMVFIKWGFFTLFLPVLVLYVIVYGFGHNGNSPEWAKTLYQIWKSLG